MYQCFPYEVYVTKTGPKVQFATLTSFWQQLIIFLGPKVFDMTIDQPPGCKAFFWYNLLTAGDMLEFYSVVFTYDFPATKAIDLHHCHFKHAVVVNLISFCL